MNQSQAPGSASSYRGLLAIVILLGMAIMTAVGAMIGAAFVSSGREEVAVPATGAGPAATAGEPFLVNLAAQGQSIASAELRDNRLLVRLTGPRGDELVVLDAITGSVIGRVVLIAPNP